MVDMAPDEQRPRRRRWLRVLSVLLLALGLALAALIAWVNSPAAEQAARRLAMAEGSKLLGEDLFVRELQVLSLRPLKVGVGGLTVHSREAGRVGLPLLQVDRVDVTLGSLLSLRDRQVRVDELVLERPRARVALNAGQIRDYAALIALLKKPKPEGKPGPPWRVDLRRVSVDDAGARVSAAPAGLGVAVTGIQLDFDRALSRDEDGRRATERTASPGSLRIDDIEVVIGKIREHAALERGSFDVEDGLLTFQDYGLDLRTGQVALSGQVPVGPPRPSAPGYRVDAQADIDLSVLHDAYPKLPEISGLANLRVGVQGKGVHPELDFDLTAGGVEMLVQGPKKELLFKLGDISLRGYYLEDLLKVTRSSLHWAGGRIGLEAALTLRKDLPFDASLEVAGLDLARVLDGVTVPGSWVQMNMDGTISLAGSVADAERGFWADGRGDIRCSDLIVRDGAWDSPEQHSEMLRVPRSRVNTRITVDDVGVHLVGGSIRGPNGSDLAVDTDFIFARPLGLRVKVAGTEFDARDLNTSVAGLHVEGHGGIEVLVEGPTNDLDISGALELDDFVFLDWPFGRVQGDVHWHVREDLEFSHLRGQRGESSFESEVRVQFADVFRGGTRERLEVDIVAVVPEGHARAEDLLPIFFGSAIDLRGAAWGRAHLYGPPSALNGEGVVHVEQPEYLWERFESMDMAVRMKDGDLYINEGWARKQSGKALFARGSIGRKGAVDVAFHLPEMGVAELAPVIDAGWPLTGRVSGVAVLSGDLKNTWVDGRLRVRDASWGADYLGDTDVEVKVQDHVATANGTALAGALQIGGKMTLEGIWPYSFGIRTVKDVSLDPWLPKTILGRSEPVTAWLGGSLSGFGTLRDQWHTLRLTLPTFDLVRGNHQIRATKEDPIIIALERGAFRFEEVHLTSPDGATNLGVEGWLRPGGPLDVDIAGVLDIAFIDLAADVFDRAEAKSLTVEQLSLAGTTQSLDMEGVAELKDALIKTIYFPHAIELERARVSLRDRVVKIEELEGRLGGGRLEHAAGSTIRLDRSGYRPRQYDLHVECADCTVRYPTFLPPARGTASLWLRGIAPDGLTMGGRVHIEEMVLRDTMNWQRSMLTFREKATENLAEANEAPLFGFDVSIDSAPGMARILNNLGDIRGTARGLHVGGDSNSVLITGLVELNAGTFRYKGQDFQLEPGSAEFREGTEWFPWLEVTMFSDVATRDEDYRITLNATGRLDNPTLTSTSEPYLSEADINSLLLFGLTQEELERAELADLGRTALAAAASTYGETAVASLNQNVTGGGRNLLPDRFEIVPVYTDTTGSTSFWGVLTKELIPDRLTVEAGLGFGAQAAFWAVRAKLRLLRNFYIEGSWVNDENASQNYGNIGLDVKLEFDFD